MWRILGACLVTVAACRPPAPAAEPGAPRVLAYSITMQNRPAGSIEIRIAADGTRDAELAFSVRGAEERSPRAPRGSRPGWRIAHRPPAWRSSTPGGSTPSAGPSCPTPP